MKKAPQQNNFEKQKLSDQQQTILEEQGALFEEKIRNKIQELDAKTVEGHSNDGLVTVTCNGKSEITGVHWDSSDSTIAKNTEQLSKNILEAVNDALYTMDLILETELSCIEYEASQTVIKKIQKPQKVKHKYKEFLSGVKDDTP